MTRDPESAVRKMSKNLAPLLLTAWAKTDGKKTGSGVVLTLAALAGYKLELLDQTAAGGLLLTGLTALTAGLTHKAVKRRRRKKDTP